MILVPLCIINSHTTYFLLTFNIGTYGYRLDHGKKLMFLIDQQYRKEALKNGYFIKMVLKIAEYHDKIHFDLSSFFFIMKISFFSLAV